MSMSSVVTPLRNRWPTKCFLIELNVNLGHPITGVPISPKINKQNKAVLARRVVKLCSLFNICVATLPFFLLSLQKCVFSQWSKTKRLALDLLDMHWHVKKIKIGIELNENTDMKRQILTWPTSCLIGTCYRFIYFSSRTNVILSFDLKVFSSKSAST